MMNTPIGSKGELLRRLELIMTNPQSTYVRELIEALASSNVALWTDPTATTPAREEEPV